MNDLIITCGDISESSDDVWEAVCAHEDHEYKRVVAIHETLNAADRQILKEEIERINAKRLEASLDRAAERRIARKTNSHSWRNAMRAEQDGTHALHQRIMRMQGT